MRAKVNSCAAGWSSSVARRAHNPEVAGSNPVPATMRLALIRCFVPDQGLSLCLGRAPLSPDTVQVGRWSGPSLRYELLV